MLVIYSAPVLSEFAKQPLGHPLKRDYAAGSPAGTTHRAAVDYAIKQSGFRYLFPGFVRGREHLPTAYLHPNTIPEWRSPNALLSPESTARSSRNDRKFTGVLLSQRLWCAASVARRAALRLLPRLPDNSHPFSDVGRPPDRPRCHANFARHSLSETHKPSLPALDPVPLRSGTGHGTIKTRAL